MRRLSEDRSLKPNKLTFSTRTGKIGAETQSGLCRRRHCQKSSYLIKLQANNFGSEDQIWMRSIGETRG